MDQMAEVIVQTTDEPDMRVYNVKYELTEAKAEDGCRGGAEDLGAFGRLLMGIRGVEVVRVQPYRFFISKAVMFHWDEIHPKVMSVLESLVASQRLLSEDFSELVKASQGPR